MSQLEQIASYWDQRSSGYSLDNQEELIHDQEKWLNLLAPCIELKPGLKVLDLGCGPGFFSILLAKQNCQVTAIDYSEKMLEEAKSNAKKNSVKINFQRMDVQNLDFDSQSFDFIITRNVTWNLEKPIQAYKEMFRVLKDNGHLINVDGNHYYYYQDQDYDRHGHSEHQHMEGINVSIIDNIAKELSLSYKLRPNYDQKILKEIGFSKVESQILNQEKTSEGKELIRQFLIHAIK